MEIIEDVLSGILMPFDNSDFLAEKIALLQNDNAFRARLADGLGKITRAKFEAGVNAERFLEFAETVRRRHG